MQSEDSNVSKPDPEMVPIDGSVLEGGGQILRMAISLSALKKKPVKISNIRSGRKKPGLAEQHLKGVELVRDICHARVTGATFGSTEVEFRPNAIKGGLYKAPVRTAGSISLLLQVALPCALFADSEVHLDLQGGTNCIMAPQIDYMMEVYKPVLEKFGATFDCNIIRRGYFPKGGGHVKVTVKPVEELHGLNLVDQGEITSIKGWSYCAGGLNIRLAEYIAKGARTALRNVCNNVQITSYKEEIDRAPDSGMGILIVAESDSGCIFGGSAIPERGEVCEDTGARAARELLDVIKEGACVDKYCQDQIIILMALAKGESRVRVGEVTLHTKTAIFVAETLTSARFDIVADGRSNIIHCSGRG